MSWLGTCLLAGCVLLVGAECTTAGRHRRDAQLRDMSSHLYDRRLPRDLDPAGYSISLVPLLEAGVFSGHVWINITCRRRTSYIVLHAHEDLAVSEVRVAVNPVSSSVVAREISVKHMERDLGKQWLIIMLYERLERDNSYRLHLSFNGSLDNEQKEGLYRNKMYDTTRNRTHWYAATNMKLDSARRIFPCFDEPEFKAMFEVKIATPARQHAVSNMPVADVTDMAERPGWYWKHFTKSPPMATMSFGMFMFEFEHYSLSKGVLRVAGRTAAKGKLETGLEKLDQVYQFFVDYMGVEDPLPKLDVIAVPDGIYNSLFGSFGLVTISESSVDDLEALAYLTVGQWVNHLMSPQWWGELDVSTGLALHFGHTFLEKVDYINAWDMYSTYYEYAKVEPFRSIGQTRDSNNFERATWFIRMIQYSLSEETFMKGFRKFLQTRVYDTFSEHDLWTTLTEQGWHDDTLPRDVTVEDVAKSWLTKERFPVLTVTRDYGRRTATAEQHVFLRKKYYKVPDKEQMLWYIPIMYITPSTTNVSAAHPVAWMKNQRQMTLKNLPEANQFIIVNPEEMGMFIVNYDATNWALLTDALNKRKLPVAVRAKLLQDAWNLAFAGELHVNFAMNMTLFLKDETEYAVWASMNTMFDDMGSYLDGTRAGEKFKRYCAQLAKHALEKSGNVAWRSSSENRNVVNSLRQIIRMATNKNLTQRHRSLFDAWAHGNGDSSPKTVEAMCLTFKHGSMEEFERGLQRVLQVLNQNKDVRAPSLVRLITNCAKHPDKIERLLRVALLSQNPGLTDHDRLVVVHQLSASYLGYSTMFSFLRDNWDALQLALEDKPDLWVDFVEDAMTLFTTEAGLKMAAQMFAARREQFGNAAPVVQAGIEEMTANVQWSKANIPALEYWLDTHLPSPVNSGFDFF